MNQGGAKITLVTIAIRADYKKEQAQRTKAGIPFHGC